MFHVSVLLPSVHHSMHPFIHPFIHPSIIQHLPTSIHHLLSIIHKYICPSIHHLPFTLPSNIYPLSIFSSTHLFVHPISSIYHVPSICHPSIYSLSNHSSVCSSIHPFIHSCIMYPPSIHLSIHPSSFLSPPAPP